MEPKEGFSHDRSQDQGLFLERVGSAQTRHRRSRRRHHGSGTRTGGRAQLAGVRVPARDLRAAAQGDGGEGQRAAGRLRPPARKAGHPGRPADPARLQPGGPDTGLEAGHHVRLHAAARRPAHGRPGDRGSHHVGPQPLVRVPGVSAAARTLLPGGSGLPLGGRAQAAADRAHLQEGLLEKLRSHERGGEARSVRCGATGA